MDKINRSCLIKKYLMGSVQPELFHLMWNKKNNKEIQYEYKFKFINYHSDISVNNKIYEDTRIRAHFSYDYWAYVNTYSKTENNMVNDFSILQAKIYQINPSSEKQYLGKVEYFSVPYCVSYSHYSNGGIINNTIQYLYYLAEYPSFPHTPSLNTDALCYKYTNIEEITDNETGVLYKREEIITQVPQEAFTINFGHFTDNVTLKVDEHGIYIDDYTYPSVYLTQEIIKTTTEGITHDTVSTEIDSGRTTYVDFKLYNNTMKDYYLYKDNLYKSMDERINMPTTLIKCSDGLTYETFVELCNITSNFNQNSIITFDNN